MQEIKFVTDDSLCGIVKNYSDEPDCYISTHSDNKNEIVKYGCIKKYLSKVSPWFEQLFSEMDDTFEIVEKDEGVEDMLNYLYKNIIPTNHIQFIYLSAKWNISEIAMETYFIVLTHQLSDDLNLMSKLIYIPYKYKFPFIIQEVLQNRVYNLLSSSQINDIIEQQICDILKHLDIKIICEMMLNFRHKIPLYKIRSIKKRSKSIKRKSKARHKK